MFTKEPVKNGEFLLHYCGENVPADEASNFDDQTYLYYYQYKNREMW